MGDPVDQREKRYLRSFEFRFESSDREVQDGAEMSQGLKRSGGTNDGM